jgi:nucleotide-binding universal stress UspA family protein
MYEHILCPTDLTDRSHFALRKAVQIAHQFEARITMLNLHREFMDKKEMEMLRVSYLKMQEKFKETALSCKRKMRESIRELHAEDIEIAFLLRQGDPKKDIVSVASECGADLIVIATDGRDNLMDFVTGTITEHVINNAACPVLVIPYTKMGEPR